MVDRGCAATCPMSPFPMATFMRLKHSRVREGGQELHSISCQQIAKLCDGLLLRRAPLSGWAQTLLRGHPPEALWGGLWPRRGLHCCWGALARTEALQAAMPCRPAQKRILAQTAEHRQSGKVVRRVSTWRHRSVGHASPSPILDWACLYVSTGPQLICSTCMQLPFRLGCAKP